MKYHAVFVIFEKAAKFVIVVCCKLCVALFGLILEFYDVTNFFMKEKSEYFKYIFTL